MRRVVVAATTEGSVVGCVPHSRERWGDDPKIDPREAKRRRRG